MPDPPVAPSLEDMGNPSVGSMTSTLSSVLVDVSEAEDDDTMKSPLRTKKKNSEDHTHFEGSEYKLEKDGNGTHWLDPNTAAIWPLGVPFGDTHTEHLDDNDPSDVHVGEMAAFPTSSSLVSPFVDLFCSTLHLFFLFSFF